jgi:hypothetical protein
MTDDRKSSYEFFPSAQQPPSSPPQPVGVPPGWTHSQQGYGPTPPPRAGLPIWLVALIATAMALVILGILAAIAIPVFISQKAKSEWSATTVALPASVAGLDRITGAEADALIKTLVQPPLEAKDIGAYGTLGPKVVVVMAIKTPAAVTEAGQAQERDNFLKGAASSGFTVTQLNEAGALGGWFGCTPAQAKPTVTICLATDQGSLFSAVIGPAVANPAQMAQQAREATITRR